MKAAWSLRLGADSNVEFWLDSHLRDPMDKMSSPIANISAKIIDFLGIVLSSSESSQDILQLRDRLYSDSGEQFSNTLGAIISIYFGFVRKAWYDERHFGVRCSSFLSSVAVLTVACTYSLKSSLMHCMFPFPLPSQHLVGPSVSIPNWKINIGGGSTFVLQKTNIQDDDNILSKSCQPKKLSLEKVIKWQK